MGCLLFASKQGHIKLGAGLMLWHLIKDITFLLACQIVAFWQVRLVKLVLIAGACPVE